MNLMRNVVNRLDDRESGAVFLSSQADSTKTRANTEKQPIIMPKTMRGATSGLRIFWPYSPREPRVALAVEIGQSVSE